MRQNGGYFDRQKADLIFAGAAGSRISERSSLPLRSTMAGTVGKGVISRLLSAKPFLWLAGLSPYGFLIHQVLIRYMEWTADKFSLTVHPVVWTLTVYLLTLCLSSFYKALEHRVRQRLAKQ